MQRARVAARPSSSRARRRFAAAAGMSAVGSSGTVRAIGEAIRELDPAARRHRRATGSSASFTSSVELEHIRDLKLSAITDDRQAVFPGGVAILAEVFEQLGIESMRVADGAMREGLLYDMLGRYTDEDARERTVRSMQQRYHVDLAQAERVEATALDFLSQTCEEPGARRIRAIELLLRWAARLHEIGLDVSHSGYHRHGAYLLENADMAGFPREEQQLLAIMVGGHRRKLCDRGTDELAPPWDKRAPCLIVLLRLAVLLHRGRSSVALPAIKLIARADTLEVRFPAGVARRIIR